MKRNYLKLTAAILAALTIGFTSCDDDTDNKDNNNEDPNPISADITENTTWESGNVYTLKTRVAVTNGATLTIEPGVIVKGAAGTGTNATALIITRGSKIMAEGTAAQPIIFTSTADDIEPGQIASPYLASDLDGLWGGVIILGNAKISPKGGATEASIEGIPADDENGKYGGSDDTDDSGIFKYVSIRHGGSNIGEGNEINGLTLGGVGSGTTISHVEIIANQDDGIEIFGGTVNVSNVLVWNNGDDAIDCDQAWNGTISNGIIINPGDEAFELDGPEATYVNGNYTIQNFSVYAKDAEGLVDNDANTNVNMNNILFFGVEDGQDFDEMPVDYTCTFADFEIILPVDEDTDAVIGTVADYFPEDQSFVTAVTTPTVGADKSEFTGWTWAAAAGKLTDF